MKDSEPKKEKPAPVADHTERIRAQVLAITGVPCRMSQVQVSQHHGGHYRVNIWEQPESSARLAVMLSDRITSSYYLTVSDTGEILDSNPPLAKLV